MNRLLRLMACLPLLLTVAAGAGGLSLGRYYSDHMVLQRGKANMIRGVARPGAEVKVSFSGQEKTGKADDAGVWAIQLDPVAARDEATDLVVTSGREKVAVKDVVVGDVVLFARQTSKDVSLGRGQAGQKAASGARKNFRAIVVQTVPSATPRVDLDENATDGWEDVDKDRALKMSAAAFYLGRDLANEVDVPVGIVDVNMGWHFPIAWLSRETILETEGSAKNRLMTMEAEWAAYESGEPYGKQKQVIKDDPTKHPLYPAAGYNAVINPLKGIAFKGLIVQLGNDYPYMYYEKLRAEGLMTDRSLMNQAYIKTYDIRKVGFRMEPSVMNPLPEEWRIALGDDSLPMALVNPPSSDLWTYAGHNREMRELQRKIAEGKEAVDIILPGMMHTPFSGQPQDDALLAERSLKWALGALYGEGLATGPLYERIEAEGTEATVYFKEGTAKGLKADKEALDYFEVANVDAQYVPARAVIDGETIKLTCDAVSRIFYVRYNWTEHPNEGLVNRAGLPALPFRTEDASYSWFFRHKEDDLPEQYFKPANEWKAGAVTFINAQLERIGYPHFSGWLGPIGVKTGPFGPNMGVREIKRGSPAKGKLFVGDVIYSANGKMLGDEEEMTMSAAITESEATDGKLVLGVHRDGRNLDVELRLEVMGRYSETSPWNCLKTERIVENLEAYLAQRNAPAGFLHGDAMFLLGAGSPEYQWLVRRTAMNTGVSGGNNWSLGYATQYLSEYYLATGDRRVLPTIQKQCDLIKEMQIREDSNRNGGWYGRDVKPRGYPAMAHAGISAMLGLTLARECGVNVDEKTFQRGLAYLQRKGAEIGVIIYGDAFRDKPSPIDPKQEMAGKLSTANGKVAEAAVMYDLLGDKRSAYIDSHISVNAWYSTYGGHGGHYWDVYWTPLGAAVHSKEAYQYFMKNHRWFRECNRMFDGSLITGGKAVAASGLALVVPRRRLRILGAAKSPFSPDAPEILKPALAAYYARDYAQAETLCKALLEDGKLARSAAPTVGRLAEEAKRMQEGIAADLARIEALSKEGRLYEAGLMLDSLQPTIAESDPRLAAAMAQIKTGAAREGDKALYSAAVKAGSGLDADEAKAQSADDLKKIQERKEAEVAAARAAARTWVCLTPKEFTGKKGKPSKEAVPADQATKWRFTVLENRDNAPEGWEQPDFDDSDWIKTLHPVSWHLNHTALHRAKFMVKDRKAFDLLKFKAWVFRQQDVAIYLNGNLIGRVNNIEKKTGTIEHEFKQAAMKHLKNGENAIAIATRQNWRWGMLFMRVYNGGFDFMLFAREMDDNEE